MIPIPNRASSRAAVERWLCGGISHCTSQWADSGTPLATKGAAGRRTNRQSLLSWCRCRERFRRMQCTSDFSIGPGPTRCDRSGVTHGTVLPGGPSNGCRDRWPVGCLSHTKRSLVAVLPMTMQVLSVDGCPRVVGSAGPGHRGHAQPGREISPRPVEGTVHVSVILRGGFLLQASLTVLATPFFVALDPVPGLGLELRVVGQECNGRSIQCTAGKIQTAGGSGPC